MDYCCINCGSGFEKEEIITINEDDFCNYCSTKVNENI
jgi:DNA-directed RNA polymerase subunit RPC12/RpoP